MAYLVMAYTFMAYIVSYSHGPMKVLRRFRTTNLSCESRYSAPYSGGLYGRSLQGCGLDTSGLYSDGLVLERCARRDSLSEYARAPCTTIRLHTSGMAVQGEALFENGASDVWI